ncbi:uncharacterized protein LOC128993999 [Macrosteles quadrilineatus]|uniref:uncharacterized protein LOC128993999 n=1 Tax=Macrosteles quadrilineatus TaxID=74068 RepID=UPI0023E340E9|nr:uncharacterized protein LOC128993999 [Macrosteles quadrilineatus]
MGSSDFINMSEWVGLLLFAFTISRLGRVSGECTKQDYQYCVKLADPLLKDPQLIYPDKQQDIDHVCRTWSLFVNCVKDYTEKCFTERRRQEFNKAVESPVDSIHQLCTVPEYQNEYLKHASCMKATLTKDSHCGRHYRHLAAQVSGDAGRAAICCSHHRFRECVLDRTRNTCDPQAGPFSRQILDKALSFLKDQCHNYEPTRVDCPGSDFYTPLGRTDGAMDTVTRANTKPTFDINSNTRTTDYQSDSPSWSDSMSTKTVSGGSSSHSPDWLGQSPSWMPGRGRSTTGGEVTVTSQTISEHTFPRSSYGRGMSWMPSTPSTTPSSAWRPPTPSPTPWYPSRNNEQMMMDNAIDEPNQQGLESSSSISTVSAVLLSIALTAVFAR